MSSALLTVLFQLVKVLSAKYKILHALLQLQSWTFVKMYTIWCVRSLYAVHGFSTYLIGHSRMWAAHLKVKYVWCKVIYTCSRCHFIRSTWNNHISKTASELQKYLSMGFFLWWVTLNALLHHKQLMPYLDNTRAITGSNMQYMKNTEINIHTSAILRCNNMDSSLKFDYHGTLS